MFFGPRAVQHRLAFNLLPLGGREHPWSSQAEGRKLDPGGVYSAVVPNPLQALLAENCRDPGSSRGSSDLQSDALPTELSRLCLSLASQTYTIERSVRRLRQPCGQCAARSTACACAAVWQARIALTTLGLWDTRATTCAIATLVHVASSPVKLSSMPACICAIRPSNLLW